MGSMIMISDGNIVGALFKIIQAKYDCRCSNEQSTIEMIDLN